MVRQLEISAREKNLYIKLDKPKIVLPSILLDKNKIRQVFLNLISNAVKYTNKGGILIKSQITNNKLQIVV